ncbi:hypothetical protein Dimus_008460 [Dionaea muscipula]
MNTSAMFSSSSMKMIIVVVVAVFLTTSSCTANASLVQETCTKIAKSDPNVNGDFCVATLNSDPASGKATNLEQLGMVSLRICMTKATNLQPRISGLLQQGTFDQYAKNCLKDCLKFYSDAKDSLQSAVGDFKVKDFPKASLDITAAMDSSGTCEDQFGERSGAASPLTKENGDFFQTTAISLSISAMLR